MILDAGLTEQATVSEGVAALSARVTPVRVSEGNDVPEYHQSGDDVRAWALAVADIDVRFPLRVVSIYTAMYQSFTARMYHLIGNFVARWTFSR